MKRFVIVLVLAVFSLIAVFAYAGSSGGQAPAVGKTNIPLTVPKKLTTSCVTVAGKRAPTINQFDVSTTTMVNWKAYNSTTGAAVVVKRSFDSYSSNYFPGSSETNLPIGATISKINFKSYSTAGHRICLEPN